MQLSFTFTLRDEQVVQARHKVVDQALEKLIEIIEK